MKEYRIYLVLDSIEIHRALTPSKGPLLETIRAMDGVRSVRAHDIRAPADMAVVSFRFFSDPFSAEGQSLENLARWDDPRNEGMVVGLCLRLTIDDDTDTAELEAAIRALVLMALTEEAR